ncbi:arsenite methyltransferase [Gammaproteobacteria bacterium]|nr:arsenite methyltransferase [Gammaproteobacteria bacterium]
MNTHREEGIRQAVRETYANIAKGAVSGCGCGPSSCCGVSTVVATPAEKVGYSREQAQAVPQGAEMGLGCGNPQVIANLKPGETVLDLGSGGGFDCLLAAHAVGDEGQVIGVDMTPEMIDRARANADNAAVTNVEFRLGEIEHLPVADATVDVIISNCVINLATDKGAVYREAYRVLKTGGRLAIADMVARAPLPESIRDDVVLYAGCIGGAASLEEIKTLLSEIGFIDVEIQVRFELGGTPASEAMDRFIAENVVSATIEATKS